MDILRAIPLVVGVVLALCSQTATWGAELRLPGIFGDHMVLQQSRTIPVWGWAEAGDAITVTLGSLTAATTTAADGKWRVDLPSTTANGQPQRLVVSGRTTVACDDVLVGDVWLCSGQSNMEFGVLNIRKKEELHGDGVRVFCLTKSAALTSLDDTLSVPKELVWDTSTGHWSTTPDAGTWNGFSAVGYLYGLRIHQLTGNPVGLIGSYWGGTPAQAWTSREALERDPALAHYAQQVRDLKPEQRARYPVVWANYVAAMRTWSTEVFEPDNAALRTWETAAKAAQQNGTAAPPKPQPSGKRPTPPGNEGLPTTLFNGMINPLIPYAITGVVWYQGEANVHDGEGYGILFSAMIRDWRARWGQGDFPFLFVQLAGYGAPVSDPSRGTWAALRAGQRAALALPNTAMAVAIDVGTRDDIHPRNKAPVAERLAAAAQRVAYGKDVVASGPTFAALRIDGSRARVSFVAPAAGLISGTPPPLPGAAAVPAGADLLGFEIAGADQHWFRATAVIDGTEVVVTSDQVPQPVAVRYAWGDFPACSLYNAAGLPAVPFRTDAWNPKAAFETPH